MVMPRASSEAPDAVAIAVMAKAPVSGLAKTRLIPHLGAEGAAALQGWLLQRTVDTALQAGLGPVTLWCAPDIRHPAFAALQSTLQDAQPIRLQTQPAGDLGQRMQCAARASSSPCTLIIGTDCPLLTPEILRAAAAALRENEVVLIPAEDGGYVLIGLRADRVAETRLFDNIDWSTPRVMAQTRHALHTAGCCWHEMATLWDVDHAADFERLTEQFPALKTLNTLTLPTEPVT